MRIWLLALVLSGCGMTTENKLWDIRNSLHSPEMERAIQHAKGTQ